MIDFVENINTAVDKDEYSMGILLDLAKAFDTVNNDLFNSVGQTWILWYKRINTIVMVQELHYRSDRKQYVKYKYRLTNDRHNMWDSTGVCSNGPLLFYIYINDIKCFLSHYLQMPTNIIYKSTSLNQLISVTNS